MGGFNMAINYTEEQVKDMIDEYSAEPTRKTVEILAKRYDKSVKSIIGKLSREGVYKKTEYTTKTGEKPITKLELVEDLALLLEIPITALAGLEKAPKTTLKALKEAI